MNRTYLFPIIILAVAFFLWFFNDERKTEEGQPAKKTVETQPSETGFSPNNRRTNNMMPETGALEVRLFLEEAGDTDTISGVLNIRSMDSVDTVSLALNLSNTVNVFKGLNSGTYEIDAVIDIPGNDYSFILKPEELVIRSGEITLKEITIPVE